MAKQSWVNKLAFWRGDKKAAETYIKVMLAMNTATWSSRHFHVFALEGFRDNATVRACIKQIITAARSCGPTPYDANGDVIKGETSLMKLLARPNPIQTWEEWLETAIIYRLVGGEAPIWLNGVGSRIQEVWILRPDWLELVEKQNGLPYRYRYTPVDGGMQLSVLAEDLIMWKELNPLDPYRGLSLLWSCAYAVDTLNQYAKSNKALIDNGVQPSGIVYSEVALKEDVFKRLKKEMDDTYVGSQNTGKPMLLEGLKWQQTGITMRDAEFVNGVKLNKIEVSAALGVPGQLIGIEGSQTFANYEQARSALYEDTVIPLMRSLYSKIYTIAERMGEKRLARIDVDIEAIPALEPRRTERNKFIDASESLSVNEKRTALGWEPIGEAGDMILVAAGKIPLEMAGLQEFQDAPAKIEDAKPVRNAKPVPDPAAPLDPNAGAVQQQALNGAQMTALQEVAQAVADGVLPPDTAIALIRIAIPTITDEQAQAFITPAANFTPKVPLPATPVLRSE